MPTNPTFRSALNLIVLVSAAIYFIFDIIGDYREGEPLSHMAIEALVFALIVIFFTFEILSRIKTRKELNRTEDKLTRITTAVSERIQRQFDQWQFSVSEKDVAWLIIKGFSFAEIAALRKVKEKTVRQQATAIYAKAQVGNRSEFTASFLEDLLAERVA